MANLPNVGNAPFSPAQVFTSTQGGYLPFWNAALINFATDNSSQGPTYSDPIALTITNLNVPVQPGRVFIAPSFANFYDFSNQFLLAQSWNLYLQCVRAAQPIGPRIPISPGGPLYAVNNSNTGLDQNIVANASLSFFGAEVNQDAPPTFVTGKVPIRFNSFQPTVGASFNQLIWPMELTVDCDSIRIDGFIVFPPTLQLTHWYVVAQLVAFSL